MSFLRNFYKRFLVFGMASVIFAATFTLSSSTDTAPVEEVSGAGVSRSIEAVPRLTDKDTFPVVTAQGVYAYDLGSGAVLYEKNPDEQFFPASTTKIMTALVALDTYGLDQVINTGEVRAAGSRMGLTWYENITVRDLLYGLLVYSGNDAAEVLAASYEGGRGEFVRAMNEKAREIHAYKSNFENPSGLDQTGQMSTARDLARISAYAMRNPYFAEIVGTSEYVASSVEGNIVHTMKNRNDLLGKVEGVLGVKTGFTEGARENLVTYVSRDGREIIIALLGSQNRFSETEELLEWIFENYEWQGVSY